MAFDKAEFRLWNLGSIRIVNIESSRARTRLYPRHANGRFLSFLIIFIVLVIYLLFCVLNRSRYRACILTISTEIADASKLGRMWFWRMQMCSFAYPRRKKSPSIFRMNSNENIINVMQMIAGQNFTFKIISRDIVVP